MTTERKTDKLKVATYHTMASFAILETFVLVHVLISLLVTPDKRLGAFAAVIKPKSCEELLLNGNRISGEYTIWIDGVTPTNAYCNMDTDGGGWTVIQRRVDASTDFYRNWNAYKQGFGNLSNNFWLGLDNIHKLTEEGAVLRIDMTEIGGKKAFAKYSRYKVGSESTNYQLQISGYSGNAGDSLIAYHNGMSFSTKDKDNDAYYSLNCASSAKGAWWYNRCGSSSLNGQYSDGTYNHLPAGHIGDMMTWASLSNRINSIIYSEMEVRVSVASPGSCKQYNVLSDQARLNTFGNHIHSGCDSNLDGWYRFMGKAGDRMLDSCPSQNDNSSNSCGSKWQGWLNDSNPDANEGEVYRRVCFSRYPSCHCDYEKIIKAKNCGYFYVYRLIGVPRCSQRYCGVKDKKLTVSCGSNYIRIDLIRRYFNMSRYSSIMLRDPTCKATISSTYITLGSIPSLCGVEIEETTSKIIYKNKVIMTTNQQSDIVSRDDEEIHFKCTYERDGVASGVSFEPIRRVIGEESDVGKFTFEFAMYQTESYASQYYSYPIKVKLRDWLFFQATASVQDSSLILLIDQCYSTPNMNRNHPKKYFFINNGCPSDNTVRFHNANGQKQRISIHAFRYLGNITTVYVHCLVFLCHKSSRDYRCHSGCPGNNVKRVRRDLVDGLKFARDDGSHSKYYLLEAGPIALEKEEPRPNNSNQGQAKQGSLVIALVIGIVALTIVVAGLMFKRRHPRPVMKQTSKEIGMGNAAIGQDTVIDGKVDNITTNA